MEITIGEGGVDWPAWVQAVGSIMAILVSTLLAIWVPVWVRRVEDRSKADVAQRQLIQAIDLLAEHIYGLRTYVQDPRGDLQGPVIRSVIETGFGQCRRMIEGVPTTMLGYAAYSVANAALQRIGLLQLILLAEKGTRLMLSENLRLDATLAELNAWRAGLRKMEPVWRGGSWQLLGSDHLEHEFRRRGSAAFAVGE